jgi:hypothetical protein
MKTIQSQNQSEELRKVVESIVQDLEKIGLYEGKLSIERAIPPAGTPTSTPAGYPHLAVHVEKQKKFLGLIAYKKKELICVVKEGFYDIQEKGRKDMLVLLQSKDAEIIIKAHLEKYGNNNQVTEIVYRT